MVMKASELRALDIEELQKKEIELSHELFSIKFQLHTGRLENPARVATVRKDIARVKTLIQQKRS
jgi:large subunit ribosomal protein L29